MDCVGTSQEQQTTSASPIAAGVELWQQSVTTMLDWLIELRFYVPLDTKHIFSETFPKSIAWLGMEKLNLTQQKHAFTDQKKCTKTQ